MRVLLLLIVSLALANPVWAEPQVVDGKMSSTGLNATITMRQGDMTESEAIDVRGVCTARFQQAGSDSVTIHAVPTRATTADGTNDIATLDANESFTWKPETFYVKVKGVTAAAGDSVLLIQCFNQSSQGGMIPVYSWADVEAVMRAHDLPAPSGANVATESVNVGIVFAPDFALDAYSTSPQRINLSTGGGEQPVFIIDFNGHNITSDAITALEVFVGNTAGKCDPLGGGGPDGYYEFVDGCMGVAHDYDIYLLNAGTVTTFYDTCDVTPTANCGRVGIDFFEQDFTLRPAGTPYGGRIHFVNMNIGSDLLYADDTSYPQLSLPGDAAVKFTPQVAHIEVRGGQWHSITAFHQRDYDATLSASGGFNSFSITNWRWIQSGDRVTDDVSDCEACKYGMFEIEESLTAESASTFAHGLTGYFYGRNIYSSGGSLGNTKGGIWDFEFAGVIQGALDAECYETAQGTKSRLINNGSLTSDTLFGRVKFNGSACVRGWIETGGSDGFTVDAHIDGDSGSKVSSNDFLPGFFYADSTVCGGACTVGTDRYAILDMTGTGGLENITANFTFTEPVLSFAAIDPDGFFSADINDGDAFSGLAGRAMIRFEGNGYRYRDKSDALTQDVTNDQDLFALGRAPVVPYTSSGTQTLTNSDLVGKTFVTRVVSGAITFTLPPVQIGLTGCWIDTTGQGIALSPQAGEEILLDSGTLGAGDDLESPGIATPGAGSKNAQVCLHGISTTEWLTRGRVLTWVDETP